MSRLALLAGALTLMASCSAEGPAGSPEPVAPPEAPAPNQGEAPGPADAPPPARAEGEQRLQPELDPLDRLGDSCGMAPFRRFLGEAAERIPQDALPERARIVGPDTQVTMDYLPRRLNILTDEEGTVIGFKCG